MATTAVYSTSMEPQNPVADCAADSNEHHHLSRDDPDGSRQVKQNVGDGELAGGVLEQRVRHEGQERERKP